MEDNVTTNAGVVEEAQDATVEEVVPQKPKRHINQQKLQDNLWGWTFCLPLIVGTIWFVYIAFVMSVLLSFTKYTIGNAEPLFSVLGNLKKWIIVEQTKADGTINSSTIGGAWHWYREIFTKQITTDVAAQANDIWANEAGIYFFNTVFYLIGIPIGMVLAVFFAVCMSRDIKGGNFFRVVYYIPSVASSIAIVYTFRTLFKQEGVINQLFGMNFDWLPYMSGGTSSSWASLTGTEATGPFFTTYYWCQGLIAKCVVVIMSVWKGLGGTVILYIAGLSGVNAATKEAAEIDGASGWTIFWKITMPDLYPVIFYNMVTAVIGGLQIYAEPELLTNGMNAATSGYVSLIYYYGTSSTGGLGYAGQGSAYAVVLMLLILVITLFQFWLDSRKEQ